MTIKSNREMCEKWVVPWADAAGMSPAELAQVLAVGMYRIADWHARVALSAPPDWMQRIDAERAARGEPALLVDLDAVWPYHDESTLRTSA